MTRRTTRGRAAAAAIATALALAAPAQAVTGGAADDGAHPYVGMFLGDFWPEPGLEPGCAGALVAPQVFLTAAHCLAGREERLSTQLYVTFDERFQGEGSTRHAVERVAWDPGHPHDHGDAGEIAVLLLDEPVRGIAPAQLPPEGHLDRIASAGTTFDFVAYGGDPHTGRDGGVKWAAVSRFAGLTRSALLLNSQDALGHGGACGDSGGPYLPRGTDVVVAIFYFRDSRCEAHNRGYRTDTPHARAFLRPFLPPS